MAFYSYVVLDGYRYKTLAKQWRPSMQRAVTPRLTLGGQLEATFGPAALMRWEGMFSVRHGEAAPGAADGTLEGNIFTLRATLSRRAAVAFTDHNGTQYGEAFLAGPFDEQALANVWNAAGNKYFVRVEVLAKAVEAA